jgi:L-2-amino-thiazoline-4-carboxylic acid hydrolase-like protein
MIFKKMFLIMVFLPFACVYHTTRYFFGKNRMNDFFYKKIVTMSANSLSSHIPTLQKDEEFCVFSAKMKETVSKIPFEKSEVTIDAPDMVKFKVTVCQFVEVARLLGMSRLAKAFCDADIVYCQKYQPNIIFERKITLEKGDPFCDHTYKKRHKKTVTKSTSPKFQR